MDCEGAEWDIMKDSESWRHVRFVSMEYHSRPDQDHTAIGTARSRLGFKIEIQQPIKDYGLVFASRDGPGPLNQNSYKH